MSDTDIQRSSEHVSAFDLILTYYSPKLLWSCTTAGAQCKSNVMDLHCHNTCLSKLLTYKKHSYEAEENDDERAEKELTQCI